MPRVIDLIANDFRAVLRPKKTVERFLVWSWLLIIALMPFHALISTWGGSAVGPLEVWKSWKEILLLVCLGLSVAYLWRQRSLAAFLREPLVGVIGAYTALHLLLWVILRPETKPALAGLLMNLRFLGIFLLSGVLLTFTDRAKLLRVGLVTLLAGAVLVIFGGVLQLTILPKDFLRHFGYGPTTIAPYITLDNNETMVRIQSTLRGPNPFGEYLIIAGMLFVALWSRARMLAIGGLLACGILLLATASRSAWIGAIIAAATLAWLTIRNPQLRQKLSWYAAVGGAVAIGLLWWALPHSGALQNIVLHNKTSDTDIGSTAQHAQATNKSLERVIAHPLGQGPGTAGPASFYGSMPQIPENYYLQIAEEVGVLGLIFFIAINFMVARRLYQNRHQKWARIWLAIFIGLATVNLFLHGWADETTAVIWWAVAGVLAFEVEAKERIILTFSKQNANVNK